MLRIEENKKNKLFWGIAGIVAALVIAAIIGIVWNVLQPTSPKRLPDLYTDQAGTSLETYTSIVDKDNDGTDDQTDILESAVAYINTCPKYKSKYYETGYPDDGYGVCTDVVASAMKGAGYDLMKLVQEDILSSREDYEIEEPDENIDFRRVKNLRVYFAHTAISLTMDVKEVEEWQGGDIVIFEKHIGIVSDRRNKRGVPYVIHHNGTGQRRYEEDILEKRGDIVGHYRVS